MTIVFDKMSWKLIQRKKERASVQSHYRLRARDIPTYNRPTYSDLLLNNSLLEQRYFDSNTQKCPVTFSFRYSQPFVPSHEESCKYSLTELYQTVGELYNKVCGTYHLCTHHSNLTFRMHRISENTCIWGHSGNLFYT